MQTTHLRVSSAESQFSHSNDLSCLPHCVLHRIFNHLSPKDLCRCSGVCRLWRRLNKDVVGEKRWQFFYTSRWPPPVASPASWLQLYSEKVQQSQAFKGRSFQDGLFGHKAAVRCLRLIPEYSLLVTGSLDRTIRLWDLHQGTHICTSPLHDGTVKSLAVGQEQRETLRVVSGSESTIRIWRLPTASMRLDIGNCIKIKGHTGPVSCLHLMDDFLFSGSWDCSVCIWNGKDDWKLAARFVYSNWIWDICARRDRFAVCVGRKLLVQSIETGKERAAFGGFLMDGRVTCVEMTEDGRFAVTGSTDGVVRLHDIRSKHQMVVTDHGSGISDIGFEDPWLVAGSLNGTVSLINIEHLLHPETATVHHCLCIECPVVGIQERSLSATSTTMPKWVHLLSRHQRSMDRLWNRTVHRKNHCPQLCRNLVIQVRTWDFTKAVAAAKKAENDRNLRRSRKHRRRPVVLETEPAVKEDSTSDDDVEEEPSTSEQLPSICRLEHRRTRRETFWNSCCWGDSTDDSEIIDARG